MLETLRKYESLIILLVVVVLVFLFWRSSVDRAEEMAKLKTSLDSMNQRMEERAKETAAKNDAIDQQLAAAKTPQDMTRLIAMLAGMKQQPIIVPMTATTSDPTPNTGTTPPASIDSAGTVQQQMAIAQPGDMITTASGVKPLMETLAAGAKCSNSLAQCTADKADLKKNLDQAKSAAEGGSRRARVGKVIIHAVCGGGGAALGAGITKGKGTGAAIGAVSGVVGCAIFGK